MNLMKWSRRSLINARSRFHKWIWMHSGIHLITATEAHKHNEVIFFRFDFISKYFLSKWKKKTMTQLWEIYGMSFFSLVVLLHSQFNFSFFSLLCWLAFREKIVDCQMRKLNFGKIAGRTKREFAIDRISYEHIGPCIRCVLNSWLSNALEKSPFLYEF